MKNLITTVKKENNTFKFFVNNTPKNKVVEVEQHTDFTGTSFESEFPEGDTMTWKTRVLQSFSDVQAVNLVGGKLIEGWIAIA